MRHFRLSFAVTIVLMALAVWWGYHCGGTAGALQALWITAVLGVMEVSLSFDNAAVNASVLRHWNAFWQKLFLTVGIVGAFAITNDIVIIMLGLAIGAMFVRSLTVFLVRQGTLEEFVYLEHGTHYAIGILALIMFSSVKHRVPEWFTGLSGVAFIAVSLWSSVKYKKEAKKDAARQD
ncbi:MAG: hypothetical protein ACI83P_001163 [Janthinobacterium sp.]|jgi:hypothetical protein